MGGFAHLTAAALPREGYTRVPTRRPDEKPYESIDGKRIIGSSADQESAEWLMARMRQIGLTDVHTDPIDLTPQWFPQSWMVTATSGTKTLLTSALTSSKSRD